MARHPGKADPLVVHRPVVARALGVTPGGFDKWLDEHPPIPTMVVGGPGKAAQYSIPDCVVWFVRRLEAKHGGPGLNPAEERAGKDRAQGRLAEQAFKVRDKTLIPAAEAEEAVAGYITGAKTKLLAWEQTLTDRLVRAATLQGAAGVEAVLRAAVDEVLMELSGEGKAERGPADA